ncbi:MAG TPA: hypothetical protein VNP04_05055 [Alphaproteobacteria bacterium]|nr:hypothetical protein [Alphaproteobacteria bacterium]
MVFHSKMDVLIIVIFYISIFPDIVVGAGSFEHLVTFRGIGTVTRFVLGPGKRPGTERLYQSYLYYGGTLEVGSINLESGEYKIFKSPVKSESGAWAMVVGPDENIYLGTLPNAHILRLDPRTEKLTDMGRPSATEKYILQLTVASDKKLYGCTYPSAKLIRFDPLTGKAEDLGRMDTREQYGRSIAASNDGFVYIGVGDSKVHLVAYEISSGKHYDILPQEYQVAGAPKVYRHGDGKVYAQVADQYFRLEGWNATTVSAVEARNEAINRLKDGRLIVKAEEGLVRIRDPHINRETDLTFSYTGKEINVFRLGLGPDSMIYGSTILPIYFFRVDPRNGDLKQLGKLGRGEFYSFRMFGNRLLGAAYGGIAPLMIYHPDKPFAPGKRRADNPMLVDFGGQAAGWRPMAMIEGPDNKIYIGALADYGKLGGPLTVWDPRTNEVESFPHVVQDQSVVSLTTALGLIIGGTSIRGGGGSHPTQTEAKLFLWNPSAKQKIFETVPVPGANDITDLIKAPGDLVYGIAADSTLFAFDPKARKVTYTTPLPFQGGVIYNSVALGVDGQIWGLAKEGIFAIDPLTHAVNLIAKPPEPITAGFAMLADSLYYASGPKIYRYSLFKR